MGIAVEQRFQVVGVFRVAAHVRGDPGHIGEHLQHSHQPDVLLGLRSVLGRVGVDLAEPGVGVADVDHDDANAGRPARRRLDPPGGVHEQAALPAARRGPELDHVNALLQEPIEQPIRLVVRRIDRLLADGAVEAQPVAEALAQRRNVLGRTHGISLYDAELGGHGQHGFRLGDGPLGVVLALRRPGAHDVGVNVDDRAGVAQVAAVGEVLAGDVVFGHA